MIDHDDEDFGHIVDLVDELRPAEAEEDVVHEKETIVSFKGLGLEFNKDALLVRQQDQLNASLGTRPWSKRDVQDMLGEDRVLVKRDRSLESCQAKFANLRGDRNLQGLDLPLLERVARKYHERNWDQIAAEMNVETTPWICLQQYMMIRKKRHRRPKDVKHRDAQIAKIVNYVGEGNWKLVSEMMNGEVVDHNLCSRRFTYAQGDDVPFSMEEDVKLRACAHIYQEKNWHMVPNHFVNPKRGIFQLRERWVSHFSADDLYWSTAQDTLLLEAVQEEQQLNEERESRRRINWIKISHHFPNKHHISCQKRFQKLSNRRQNMESQQQQQQQQQQPVQDFADLSCVWTPAEDLILQKLSVREGENWTIISKKLSQAIGKKRSPTTCQHRYLLHKTQNVIKSAD